MQIPDYYEFLNYPKIISGKCSLESIPMELASYDARKPLVLARKNLAKHPKMKKFIKAFYDSMVTLGGIYDEVDDYAGISRAREAAFLYKERGCDSIIVLGNGPVVDVAKAANVLITEEIDNLSAYYEGAAISSHLKPLVHVPACRSNGMEATNTMTVDNRRITSDFLYPDVIVIDPRMTPGCCADCVAVSGVTALANAFTAITDETQNPMTAAMAHPALSFLSEHLLKGIKKPSNKDASQALANAAVMASGAYANSRPGMANLLAEELAAETNISTGIFLGILLPAVIAFMQKKKIKISDELILAMGGLDAYASTPAPERSQKGLDATLKLLSGLKKVLPASLQELKVQKYTLTEVAQAAAGKSGKRFSDSDCRAVLEMAWEGTR